MAEEKDHLGLWIIGSVVITAALKWLSDLTAGERHGGEFDIPIINWVAWFAFVVMAAATLMLLVAAVSRLVGRLRSHA
ncbi:MAG: hypothetical protein ACRD0N_14065 [Acidimicrobiales bacterium]